MNRSEFFRLAGSRLVEESEGEAELTAQANAVIARVGQPSADSLFLRESGRTALEAFPGNVLVPVDASELGRDSVAVVSQAGPVS